MQQKDKNIFILTIFAIIFLVAWTLFRYTSSQKEYNEKQQQIEVNTTEQIKEDSQSQEKISQSIIPTITASELRKKLFTDKNIIIVDTRTIEDFNQKHIKDSIHISDFDTLTSDATIVLVTNSGNENALLNYYRDFSNTNDIYNLTKGFTSWLNEGFSSVSFNVERNFENSSKVSFIEPRDLNSLFISDTPTDKIVIIDTRRPGNFEKEHIKNAINIPFDELKQKYTEIPNTKKIYIYGQNDDGSFKSGVLLYEFGFIGANTIKGGLDAWKEYGYPLEEKTAPK